MVLSGLDSATASLQDVFDFIVFKLVQQGRRADNRGQCQYRAPLNDEQLNTLPYSAYPLRCAVGHLIPDPEYNSAMEGRGITEVMRLSPSVNALIERLAKLNIDGTPGAVRILLDMQMAHDGNLALPLSASEIPTNVDLGQFNGWLYYFRQGARVVAWKYGLDDSICSYREASATAPRNNEPTYTAPVLLPTPAALGNELVAAQ